MGIPKIPRRRLVNWIVCGFLWHQINGACAMEKRLLHALNADSFLIGADWFPMNALWRGEPEKLAKLLSNWCRRAGGRTTATGKNDLSFNRLSRFAMKNERNKCVCVRFFRWVFWPLATRFPYTNTDLICSTPANAVPQLHLTFQLFDVLNTHYMDAGDIVVHALEHGGTAGNFWVLDQ